MSLNFILKHEENKRKGAVLLFHGIPVVSYTDVLKKYGGDFIIVLAFGSDRLEVVERFIASYAHIQQIDRHRPWTNARVSTLLDQIDPLFLTHELSAGTRAARFQAVRRQMNVVKRGRKQT